jgi:hypothetical protein
MKTLLILLLLAATAFADWTDDATRSLTTLNERVDAATVRGDVQAILVADRQFGQLLKLCRSEAFLSQLSPAGRMRFEDRLAMLADFHIRRMSIAANVFERRAKIEAEAAARYSAFSQHEDTLAELQAIEDAVRCWRY